MECQDILEKVRIHAVTRIESVETPQGCSISLPLLEPSGDVVSVTVNEGSRPGVYYVTDGGRLNGLLFESSATKPSASDKSLVKAMAERLRYSSMMKGVSISPQPRPKHWDTGPLKWVGRSLQWRV